MKTAKTNFDYWKNMVYVATPAYTEWFNEEKKYLHNVITPNSNVLEVGCGYGRSISDILDITTNVTGIDHDPHAVKDARKIFSNFPSVQILNAKATQLPFSNQEFDYSMCLTTFANFGESKYAVLGEMKRVLKSDGKIIISVFSEDALEERLKVYKDCGVKTKVLNNGTVLFESVDSSLGDHTSEQFSRNQLERIFSRVRLNIEDIIKVNIAYLCTLKK